MKLATQSLRFGAVGIANTVIALGTIFTLLALGMHPGWANALGYAVGLSSGFALNRGWTFRSRGAAQPEIIRYLAVVAASYLLNLGVVLLISRQGGVAAYLAQLAGILVYTPCMFMGLRFFVFRPAATS
jgi:putative flippase GtrA